ncbi:hypothetical protein HDF09_002631 [Edaphobacter lichenicola]|uniref:Uncharacterized protein n=1 Tax=Tunturiibacter empetritectus TaxID=3069691 RepID=A0A7W8IIT8_9BACT|nr:hypothetical protein [Edaphobacter lichenicola]
MIEEPSARTPIVCRTWDGAIVAVTSRIVLTAMDKSAPAVAKPVASTAHAKTPA